MVFPLLYRFDMRLRPVSPALVANGELSVAFLALFATIATLLTEGSISSASSKSVI